MNTRITSLVRASDLTTTTKIVVLTLRPAQHQALARMLERARDHLPSIELDDLVSAIVASACNTGTPGDWPRGTSSTPPALPHLPSL